MQNYRTNFIKWKVKTVNHPDLQKELQLIETNLDEIQDRFYKNLEFGTGGMRGLIGAGPNRINIYTIRRATQGLANYLLSGEKKDSLKVVIAYDSRHLSREFALEAALTFAQNNIRAYVFQEITPTPILSFAVRELKADGGIVITASHNPKEYNGYKVYGSHGGQITDTVAQLITQEIKKIEDEFSLEKADLKRAEEEGQFIWLKDEILKTYLDKTKKLLLNKDREVQQGRELKIVYTPLHGTGLVPITRLFKETGYTKVEVVREQASADPDFPTLVSPNPEEQAACSMALQLGQSINADLILITDPDADRIAVAIKNNQGELVLLTGNQTGALLTDYLLNTHQKNNTLPVNGVLIKTIVTSNLGKNIASKYRIKCDEVLTGFKYIGEKVNEFEKSKEYTFLFGYEESYGYLIGDYVRDKDAIQTALCLAEMASSYKSKGLTLFERLEELFKEFGYFQEDLVNLNFFGINGQKRMQEIMANLRKNPPQVLREFGLQVIRDYYTQEETNFLTKETSPLTLPQANVLYYQLADDNWCCVRPSGTEPKLKIYFGVKAPTENEAREKLTVLKEDFLTLLENI